MLKQHTPRPQAQAPQFAGTLIPDEAESGGTFAPKICRSTSKTGRGNPIRAATEASRCRKLSS